MCWCSDLKGYDHMCGTPISPAAPKTHFGLYNALFLSKPHISESLLWLRWPSNKSIVLFSKKKKKKIILPLYELLLCEPLSHTTLQVQNITYKCNLFLNTYLIYFKNLMMVVFFPPLFFNFIILWASRQKCLISSLLSCLVFEDTNSE